MKKIYVADLEKDMEFIDFFMNKGAEIRTGSNKKEYLDIKLGDKTGEVSGKKWDLSESEMPVLSSLQPGDLIKVKAQVTEWQGMNQLRILRLRRAYEEDALTKADFVKAAPEDPALMYAYLLQQAEALQDEDFRRVSVKILTDNKDRLMYYPAASRNHHAEFAGLLWHMKRMLMTGLAACEIYDILNRDLVVTGVIIHDMEKLNEIEADENGIASSYSMKGQLLGHISQGMIMIDQVAKSLGIPEEKAVLMEHMILSHHYEPDYGSPKKPMFPEAELLHYLDILDSRMYDMEEALFGIKPGAFSERVRTLDNRRVYRPTFEKGKE